MTHLQHDDLREHLRRAAGNAGSAGGLVTAERAMTLARRHRRIRTRMFTAAMATALIVVGISAGFVAFTVSLDSPSEQATSQFGQAGEADIGSESTTTDSMQPDPEAGPPLNVETGPTDPEVGVSYPFDLYTHCGIEFTTFGGLEWQALTPRPESDRIPGPDGLVTYTGYTAGSMTLVNEGLLRFRITDSGAVNNGETVDFAPLENALAPPPCA